MTCKGLCIFSFVATALAFAGGALAQTKTFDLPSQDADKAISEFARQAGLQIIAPADQLKGVRTPAIKGRIDARAALRLLLAGSGLAIAEDDGAVITLRVAKAPSSARVQTQTLSQPIEDVVVTATKTGATDLQKTPIAVSVVGGDTLVQDNIKDARDLVNVVSGLKYTVNNVSPQIYIRGIGGYAGVEAESDVSVYIDGVYLARTTVPLQTDFNDLDRVEVLEGPQGVEFGRNAVGGAINFITKAPPDHFAFEDTLNLGAYNLVDDAFRLGGPLLNNLQGSLSVSHVQHDGYVTNVDPTVGGKIDAANRTGVRAKLKWEPTADVTDTLTSDYYWTHERFETADELLLPTTGLNAGAFPDPLQNSIIGQPWKTDMAVLPLETEQAYGVTNEVNWKINDHLSLKSITALLTDWSLANQGSVTDIIDGPTSGALLVPSAMVGIAWAGGGAGSLIPTALAREYQFSQEFNLLDTFGPLSGVLGYYNYDDHERFWLRSFSVGGNVKNPNLATSAYTFENNDQPTLSNAVFISQTYRITPTLSINGGVRYDWEHKTLNINNVTTLYEPGAAPVYPAPGNGVCCIAPFPDPFIADLNQDAHATTPKVNVTWQATPDAMLYATVSEGYHSGGFNYSARDTIGASYGPERLWSYEGGAKTEWFDHSLRINVAVFRYLWSGLQFNSLISNTPSISITSNDGRASENGLEATVIWKPQAIEGLTLTGNTTLLSSRYDDFPRYAPPGGIPSIGLSSQCTSPNGLKCNVYNATGNQLVNAPSVSLIMTAQKTFDLGGVGTAYVRGEWSYTSTMYFDPTDAPIASQPAYNLINASIGLHPAAYPQWDFTLWGKNLTNQDVNEGYAAGSLVETTPGDPLTFGVRIAYKY
jgi:iron complex outermembrane receptor protein